MSEIIIKCENVSKTYEIKGNQSHKFISALTDINFELKKGDRIGLVGLNGSGKSTLLKLLSGFIKPTSGRIYLKEKPVSLSHFDSLLHPDLSGKENIYLQLSLLGFDKKKIERAIVEIIEFSELTDFINYPVKTYSSGMMLRLTFSMFKLVNPNILLLDEVFAAGDAVFQQKVNTLMKHYLQNTDAIIIASHNLKEISEYCNKCMILQKGELLFLGKVTDALDVYFNGFEPINTDKRMIQLISAETLNESKTIAINKEIKLRIIYQKKKVDSTDIVLYVRTHVQNVLTDCIIYRENFNRVCEPNGKYLVEVTIPGNILNTGTYYIDISFGDGHDEIEYFSGITSFTIKPEEWEKEKRWNLNPTYPVRPSLTWKKEFIL